MARRLITVLMLVMVLGAIAANAANNQQSGKYKSFTQFKNLVDGIDFFASNRAVINPLIKPASETIAKLKALLGENLPRGAVFICSTLEQKDSIYEPQVLKMGYGWTITVTTAEMRAQEVLARIKSQMENEIPAEILDRIKSRMPEMAAQAEKQMVSTAVQQIAYAVLQTSLAKGLQFRSSRLDDMGKSPLPDWLDIGIAAYASGVNANLAFLQQNMDQTFPLEDIVTMSRPFVASAILAATTGNGGGGGGFPSNSMRAGGPEAGGGPPAGMMMGGMGAMMGRGQGGFGGGPGMGQRPGGSRSLSKDEQDRMLFDGQAATFFMFLLEKVGIEKVRELIRFTLEGKESIEFISREDVLGNDWKQIESQWSEWVKAQKPDTTFGPGPQGMMSKTS